MKNEIKLKDQIRLFKPTQPVTIQYDDNHILFDNTEEDTLPDDYKLEENISDDILELEVMQIEVQSSYELIITVRDMEGVLS